MPSALPPPPLGAPVPSKKGPGTAAIVLLVLAGLVIVAGLAVLAGGLFVVHKAKQAGVDADLMRTNPGLAVAKMLAATNPDIELVDVDESTGKVTLREKSSGRTVTLDFEQIRQGKISFETDEGEAGTTSAQEGGGGITGRSGTVEWQAGAEARLPAWLPAYPGAEVKGSTTSRTSEGEFASVILLTPDPVGRVSAFYRGVLERAGLKVEVASHAGEGRAEVISAASADNKRRASVIVGREEEGTVITLTAQEGP
jgi:hypothetical protein